MPTNLIPSELAEILATHKAIFGGFTMMAGEPSATEGGQSTDEPEPLGENGLKALHAEREAHKQAKKLLADLQARVDAVEAEKLSDLERAQKAAADAQAEVANAKREALRYRLAATNGISEEDAALFLTGDTEEAMQAQAERLAARNADEARKREIDALTDPTQGGGQTLAPKVNPGVPRLAAAFESEMT